MPSAVAERAERFAIDLELEHRRRQRLKDRALTQYQQNPLGFFTEILGIAAETIDWELLTEFQGHRWDYDPLARGDTRNPIKTMMDALAQWQDVGVESATGTGKSFTAAGLILWFNGSWRDSRCFTFAPKEDQLRLFIWMELQKLFPAFQVHFPYATLTDLCLRIRGGQDDSWGARGYSVGVKADEEVATKAAGMHAEHMLLIYEETPGIPKQVIEAGENTATGPHNLRLFLGNPDHQLDTLHQACLMAGVKHVRISGLDHPNVVCGRQVVPGAVGAESVERRRLKYGEQHRLYRSRVRGISPAEAADALIKLAWIQDAQARWKASGDEAVKDEPLAIGGDVANSEDGDEGAKAYIRGRRLLRVVAKPCPNANDFGLEIGRDIDREKVNPYHVGIDSVGVGAGTVNELRKKDRWQSVRALNGGATPEVWDWDAEDYRNLRSQIHWWLAEDLRLGEIDLPDDSELVQDLLTPTYKTQNGAIVVESKEDIKKRLPGGRSPNKGDAVAYANFVRPRPVPVVPRQRPRYDLDRFPEGIERQPKAPGGPQSRPQVRDPWAAAIPVKGPDFSKRLIPVNERLTSADGL